jgi:hypothetical protein
MKLKQANVSFNAEEHTYTTPDGKMLSGITGMIDRQIFGGRFSNMNQDFLRPYAEYGSRVHEEIEAFYSVGIDPETPEAKAFVQLYGNEPPEATEYTVTDGEHFATNIDFVDESGIWDFKTSATLDRESLSWQLSICAYLFECQNGYRPENLYGVHLRGDKCEVVTIDEKPLEAVLRLLEAETQGLQYMTPSEAQSSEITRILDIEQAIIRIKQEAEFYEKQKQDLLSGIEAEMDKQGLKKLETDRLIITKVLPTVSKGIDTKRLKEEMPEVAEKYEKLTEKKGFIKLTIK